MNVVFARAAEILESKQWFHGRGTIDFATSASCLALAISDAVWQTGALPQPTYLKMANFLGLELDVAQGGKDAYGALIEWNDAQESKDVVVAALRAAAEME